MVFTIYFTMIKSKKDGVGWECNTQEELHTSLYLIGDAEESSCERSVVESD